MNLNHEDTKILNHEDTKMRKHSISPELEEMARRVVDAAFTVHKNLGPGLLESVYESCLCLEFAKRKIPFERQATMQIEYNETQIDAGHEWM